MNFDVQTMASSCEPGRTKAYSMDIRWRVIWQRLGMGLRFREIAHRLNIAVGTAYNIYRLFQQTGGVEAKKARKRPEKCKLDHHHQIYIVGIVLENPSMYLREVCSEIRQITDTDVSPSTVCRILSAHGFTRKKVQHVAVQRSTLYRAIYASNIAHFPKEMLVWVDETGCDKRDLLRKYGYAFRGERASCQRLMVRGRRVSAFAALSCQGIMDVSITSQSVDGDKFCDFIRGSLIPNMMPFDGTNPASIVVMDNCAIHHVDEVNQLLEEAGILLIYLPPYSPDFNPIEEAFSKVKSYLKEHDDIIGAIPQIVPLVQSAFGSITEKQCQGWISDCKCY